MAVVGAGNLGQAQAGHLASLGHEVRLYNRRAERLAALGGEIRLGGLLSGTQRPGRLTTDLAEAITGAQILFLDVPATAHADLARLLAPLLGDPAPLLVLHPGQTFGAYLFAAALREAGISEPPPIAELQTALFTARLTPAGEATVLAIKRRVGAAVFPRTAAAALTPLRELYPQLVPAPSTLHTALSNVQALIHPAVCLANLTRIDRGESLRIYREGLSPALDDLIEQADRERMAIAAALGVRVPTAVQWFALSYGVADRTAVRAMRRVRAYDQILGPTNLSTRLLLEDVPAGLVPIVSLGEHLRVAVPTLRALRDLAAAVCGDPLIEQGWTVERLGLSGRAAADLRKAF